MGLIGTVLGLLLLGVALFRSGVVPRWVPVALWVFLAAEFALSNLSTWASPAAGLVYLAAFTALAARLLREGADQPSEHSTATLAHA
jgi:thiol:disulfide interchange protein